MTSAPEASHFPRQEEPTPRGDKDKYTSKQKRQAAHIEDGYEKRGVSKDEAEASTWATVNKMSGGGTEMRKASAKKAATTRRKRAG